MKKIFLFFPLLLATGLLLATSALAATPVLSVSSTGTGDTVQINVTGDANVSVLLFAGSQMISLSGWQTNANGVFTATISSSQYNIASNTTVYVKTGGLSGSQSNSVTWPYVQNTTTSSNMTLSQSAVLLNAGQTSTITASANYLYLSSNTNPGIANINLNANQITISANTYGSTVANICVVGSTTNCASLTITVQNSGAQQLTFSQNNFSIISGQSSSVTISGGSAPYTISNNSNSNAIQTSLSGSVITLTATSTAGAASITVCTSDLNYCGIINVSSTTTNSTAVTFSQSSPFVALSQSTTVTIYGGSGNSFYVSSNSNPSVAQVNINSNVITLFGVSGGTSNVSVCAYAGSCASLSITVGAAGSSSGPINLSQSSVSIVAGQSASITISGGSTPYSISVPNSTNIFSSAISGNALTIYGINPGSTTAQVCASVGCTNLSVTITGTTTSTNPPTFSQNNVLLNTSGQTTVYVSGNGGYYIANASSPTVASISINSSTITVTGMASGADNVYICQTGGQCATLYITVATPTTTAPTTVTTTPTVAAYVLPRYLGFGDKGDDVLKLQQLLVDKGYLKATPNGYFGQATKAAIKKFQKEKIIKQTGNIGQATKAALDQLFGSLTNTTGATNDQQIQQLQQQIQQLMSQVSQITK